MTADKVKLYTVADLILDLERYEEFSHVTISAAGWQVVGKLADHDHDGRVTAETVRAAVRRKAADLGESVTRVMDMAATVFGKRL